MRALSITHIGKETNLLDEIQAGLIGDEEQVLTEYVDPQVDAFTSLVLPLVREIPLARLAAETGLNPRTIKRIRAKAVEPSPASRRQLTRAAASYAREQLERLNAAGKRVRDDLAACGAYLELSRGT